MRQPSPLRKKYKDNEKLYLNDLNVDFVDNGIRYRSLKSVFFFLLNR